MAKNLSPVEIAEALAAMGMEVPADLQAKVENSVSDRAEETILSHLLGDDEKAKVAAAEEWRENLFTLADSMVAEFSGQEKNVGQGRVFERAVEIELPGGHKVFIRHREPREKK